MVTITPELLADLRKKADEAAARNRQPGEDAVHVVEVDPLDMRALLDRIEALEKVAKAVRGITKDAAENGNCSDCPYVSMEEAKELLAIIDGGDHA